MSDQTCVDCGQEISICDHALQRITDPTSAFQGKVIGELQDELAESTARADRLAVENAELRDVLGDAVDAHTTDEVLARAMAVLNRPADTRGAEILATANDLAHSVGALVAHLRRHTTHRCDIDRDGEDNLARFRALGVVGEGR